MANFSNVVLSNKLILLFILSFAFLTLAFSHSATPVPLTDDVGGLSIVTGATFIIPQCKEDVSFEDHIVQLSSVSVLKNLSTAEFLTKCSNSEGINQLVDAFYSVINRTGDACNELQNTFDTCQSAASYCKELKQADACSLKEEKLMQQCLDRFELNDTIDHCEEEFQRNSEKLAVLCGEEFVASEAVAITASESSVAEQSDGQQGEGGETEEENEKEKDKISKKDKSGSNKDNENKNSVKVSITGGGSGGSGVSITVSSSGKVKKEDSNDKKGQVNVSSDGVNVSVDSGGQTTVTENNTTITISNATGGTNISVDVSGGQANVSSNNSSVNVSTSNVNISVTVSGNNSANVSVDNTSEDKDKDKDKNKDKDKDKNKDKDKDNDKDKGKSSQAPSVLSGFLVQSKPSLCNSGEFIQQCRSEVSQSKSLLKSKAQEICEAEVSYNLEALAEVCKELNTRKLSCSVARRRDAPSHIVCEEEQREKTCHLSISRNCGCFKNKLNRCTGVARFPDKFKALLLKSVQSECAKQVHLLNQTTVAGAIENFEAAISNLAFEDKIAAGKEVQKIVEATSELNAIRGDFAQLAKKEQLFRLKTLLGLQGEAIEQHSLDLHEQLAQLESVDTRFCEKLTSEKKEKCFAGVAELEVYQNNISKEIRSIEKDKGGIVSALAKSIE